MTTKSGGVMADKRKLEPVSKLPGVYRRHNGGCSNPKRCDCPYVVRWKDRDGRSRKQVFATRDEAKRFKGSIDAGTTTRRPLTSATVSGYYESWLKAYRGRTRRGLEESTRREYEISFRLHVAPLPIALLKMRDVGAPDIDAWLSTLEGRGCSPTTIRKAKAALAVMFASAVQAGHLTANPVAGVRYVPSSAAKRPRRAKRKLTAADVSAILGVMDERWRAFFMLLVQTGVRIGELLGLTWEHVHLGDDPHILVAEQFYRGERKQLKTESSFATVPLSPTMAAWLAELRPVDAAASSPVFPSMTGTPLTYSNMYNRVLRPALQASGIAVKVGEDAHGRPLWDYQGVAFHAFRKACGSLLFKRGKTLKQVQGWLRHAQLTTTMNVYIDLVDDGLGGAEVWDEILDLRPVAPKWPQTAVLEDADGVNVP